MTLARSFVLGCALLVTTASPDVRAEDSEGDATSSVEPVAGDDAKDEASTEATARRPNEEAQPRKKKRKKKKASTSGSTSTSTSTSSARRARDALADAPSPFRVEAKARGGVGAMTGDGIYRTPAALSLVDVDVTPVWQDGMFEVAAPLQLMHRETWGAHLEESDAQAALVVDVKPWRPLKLSLEAGADAIVRPAWLDPYQPVDDLPDNGVLPTDRRSRGDVWLQGRMLAIPFKGAFARLKYGFLRSTSVEDPAFDPLLRPNHLTPNDHDEHTLEASWKSVLGALRPSLAVGVWRREWFFVFSRDAGTGSTHAGPGGAPPNPLQIYHALDVEPATELRLYDDTVRLALGYRLRVVEDLYEGYYSRLEHRVAFDVESDLFPAAGRLALQGSVALTARVYGDSAYAAGPSHPPLDFGDRREARGAAITLQARFPDTAKLHLFARGRFDAQRTNFPDYAPGVYPKTRAYTIDWDYQQLSGLVGVEWAI